MKQTLAILILICAALTGCRRHSYQDNVVKETYLHKYGVPISKTDWDAQGKEGQTVSLRKDGVTVTTTYAQGIVHGPVTYSFANSSTIQRIETFSQGVLISKKENYPSGVPMKEEIFENEALVKVIQWYEDGTPQIQEIYKDNALVSGEYRTPLNVVESRILEGEGKRIWRTNEGDLMAKDQIHNGQMVERITYYPNGDPASVVAYDNGLVHGTKLTFLAGGLPNTVEQWMHGIQEGITLLYQNGEKIAEIPYVKGVKHGTEYRYRDGTELAEEVNWRENVQHGKHKLFIDGEIKTDWYHEGELVTRTTFERMNMPWKNT